jgi:hypothetical protein
MWVERGTWRNGQWHNIQRVWVSSPWREAAFWVSLLVCCAFIGAVLYLEWLARV